MLVAEKYIFESANTTDQLADMNLQVEVMYLSTKFTVETEAVDEEKLKFLVDFNVGVEANSRISSLEDV